jgi:S1-C subfamily serine protease
MAANMKKCNGLGRDEVNTLVDRDSPTEKTGIVRGDIGTSVDSNPVDCGAALYTSIRGHKLEDAINLGIERDNTNLILLQF